MSLYNTYKSAGAPLTEGVWIELGECRVKVRYAGRENKGYTKCLRTLAAPYERIIGNDDANVDKATQKKLDAMFAEVYAKSVIADWENVTDEHGSPMEFSWQNAKQVLIDLPLFFDEIKKVSGSMQAFREEELEEESKN